MEKNSISDLLVVNGESLKAFENYVLEDLERINFLYFSENLFEDMYKEIEIELDFFKKTNPKTIVSYEIYRGFKNESKKERKKSKIHRSHKEENIKIFNLVDGFICFNLKQEMDDCLTNSISETIMNIVIKYMDISTLEVKSDYTKVFLNIQNSDLYSVINNTIKNMFKEIDMDVLSLLEITRLNYKDLIETDVHKIQLVAQKDFTVLLFALKKGYLDQVKINKESIIDKIYQGDVMNELY